jgi:hypothetical protein
MVAAKQIFDAAPTEYVSAAWIWALGLYPDGVLDVTWVEGVNGCADGAF